MCKDKKVGVACSFFGPVLIDYYQIMSDRSPELVQRNITKYKEDKEKMKVTVCIGSSCHIKGSRPVVEQLQDLIAKEALDGKVELSGTFCMGKCRQGVCVTVDGAFHSVSPETVSTFFEKEIKAKV